MSTTAAPVSGSLLGLLRCPACGDELQDAHASGLRCGGCGRETPVAAGIPRFVLEPEDDTAKRTQASFGYEWTHFGDWQQSGETNFSDYFEGVDLGTLRGKTVLDAGCGMGRHARQIGVFAEHVVAVDFSRAIDQAARNTADIPSVHCVQADLLHLPLAGNSFDFAYSLGVLHHLHDTRGALASIVARLKPGARIRIYLYWKKHGWQGALLSIVTAIRGLTTRLPFGVLRALCWLLSVVLFALVVVPYRMLSKIGARFHEGWPLFVYARYPFNVLYNDQFDRFSAPLEKRYDPDEVKALMTSVGLVDVRVSPCFGWIADAVKPA